MIDSSDRTGDGGSAGAARRREERLAQALRDNLKRRKDQARGRVARVPEPDSPHTTPADEAASPNRPDGR